MLILDMFSVAVIIIIQLKNAYDPNSSKLNRFSIITCSYVYDLNPTTGYTILAFKCSHCQFTTQP